MNLTRVPGRSAGELARLIDPTRLPTAEQEAVIEAPAEPLRVIAGAGSGKTETMATRVLWLLDNYDLRPEEVLCLTFTRKAAGEIAERVRRHLGRLRSADAVAVARAGSRTGPTALGLGEPTMATYNSYAAGLVKEHGLRLGVDPDAALLSDAGQWQLVSQLVESWTEDLSVDNAVSTVTAAVISLAQACHEHLREPAEVQNEIRELTAHIRALPRTADGSGPGAPYAEIAPVLASLDARAELMDLVQAFRRAKRERSVLDFGDQVAIAARLAAIPAVAQAERSRYRVVLLDEFQDTSHAQLQLLARLFGSGHPVTAVGDPNQAIYGWRGASAAGMDDFLSAFRGVDEVVPRTLTLSVSWRNPASILGLANLVAAPLRGDAHRDLPVLRSREAELGLPEAFAVIRAEYATNLEEEACVVVDYLREQWHEPNEARAEGERLSAAVLCRTRAQFRPIIDALRDAGLPYEVVGLGGLLDTPEVVDLVAALEVAHDPSRGDSLMRLLTGERLMLGAADLAALGDWSRELAHRDDATATATATRTATATPSAELVAIDADVVDERSLVDALDSLPGPRWRSRTGRALSDPGLRRLRELAATIRAIRSQTYLSVPDVVLAAERLLGLDVELMARPQREVWRARTHLDSLVNVAHDFAASAERATLGAFLAWLDAARAHERGLEVAPAEPAPGSLQILTVHAAKGLEWDVVAVPGLSGGHFPSVRPVPAEPGTFKHTGWLTELGALPAPMRSDRRHLAEWRYRDAVSQLDLRTARETYLRDNGAHELAEERRLMYVAATRSKRALLLTGSWWRSGASPTIPSIFLTELAEHGLVDGASIGPAAAERASGLESPQGEPRVASWPTTAGSSTARSATERDRRAAALRAAAHLVTDALRATGPAAPGIRESAAADSRLAHFEADARTLLAERQQRARPVAEVEMPGHLSASAVVRLAADPRAFAEQLRRPMPQEPSVAARRGVAFHSWVESFYSSASLVDVDALPGADDDVIRLDQDLAELQSSFAASPWAARRPVAVEVDVETPVGAHILRCRIDAVFEDPDGGFVVVDWKTGRPSRDPSGRAARELQLASYRLAWSRWRDVPLELVRAAFFYAESGETMTPDRLGDAAEIEALLEAATMPSGGDAGTPRREAER